MKSTRLPSARKKRRNIHFLIIAVLLATAGPTLIPLALGARGLATLPVFYEIAGGLAAGVALGWVFLWICYRPGQRLFRVMTEANPGLQVLPFYSSDPFIISVEKITGTTLTTSASPSGAFLAFVEAGRYFELWRWHRSAPRRVGRFEWAAVTSAHVGTISHFATTDRAIVLTMNVDGLAIAVPIAPQERHPLRLRPLNDDAFAVVVSRWQERVAANLPDAAEGQPLTG